MLRRRVNGYDMAHIELGEGPPLVCLHGTLGDFRVWSPILGPLSRRRRVLAVSFRHFFPEHWDGAGSDFTIAQHVDDVITFIEALGGKPADVMGHSRGGHIAFRCARGAQTWCASSYWQSRAATWMRRYPLTVRLPIHERPGQPVTLMRRSLNGSQPATSTEP